MWDKLSMKDKARYIQLGVMNGITSLEEIKKAFNYYAEGGLLDKTETNNVDTPHNSIMIEPVEVTPRTSALNASRVATEPNKDFSYAQDMTEMQRWGANNLANWFGKHIFGINPHTCLNTVTGFYNPEATVASNPNFVAHPEDYGFKEEPQEEAKPGDIIILSNRNKHPVHAVMFDSIADKEGVHNGYPIHVGDTLVNYSNGGRRSRDYRLQGPLTRFDDSRHSGGDFSGGHRYYKYVGKKRNK